MIENIINKNATQHTIQCSGVIRSAFGVPSTFQLLSRWIVTRSENPADTILSTVSLCKNYHEMLINLKVSHRNRDKASVTCNQNQHQQPCYIKQEKTVIRWSCSAWKVPLLLMLLCVQWIPLQMPQILRVLDLPTWSAKKKDVLPTTLPS